MKGLNQTWDQEGNLVFEEEIEVPEPDPTLEERVQALEDKIHMYEFGQSS